MFLTTQLGKNEILPFFYFVDAYFLLSFDFKHSLFTHNMTLVENDFYICKPTLFGKYFAN